MIFVNQLKLIECRCVFSACLSLFFCSFWIGGPVKTNQSIGTPARGSIAGCCYNSLGLNVLISLVKLRVVIVHFRIFKK
jgi:hypothetical protein